MNQEQQDLLALVEKLAHVVSLARQVRLASPEVVVNLVLLAKLVQLGLLGLLAPTDNRANVVKLGLAENQEPEENQAVMEPQVLLVKGERQGHKVPLGRQVQLDQLGLEENLVHLDNLDLEVKLEHQAGQVRYQKITYSVYILQ